MYLTCAVRHWGDEMACASAAHPPPAAQGTAAGQHLCLRPPNAKLAAPTDLLTSILKLHISSLWALLPRHSISRPGSQTKVVETQDKARMCEAERQREQEHQAHM